MLLCLDGHGNRGHGPFPQRRLGCRCPAGRWGFKKLYRTGSELRKRKLNDQVNIWLTCNTYKSIGKRWISNSGATVINLPTSTVKHWEPYIQFIQMAVVLLNLSGQKLMYLPHYINSQITISFNRIHVLLAPSSLNPIEPDLRHRGLGDGKQHL